MANHREERRKNGGLTDEQVEAIKEAIIKEIYEEIGRSVVSRLLWALGLLFTALLAYLGFTGRISLK
jgi:8-oxo-dGTP pyrophosphatase MutT (NUDIX family)